MTDDKGNPESPSHEKNWPTQSLKYFWHCVASSESGFTFKALAHYKDFHNDFSEKIFVHI